MTLVVHQLCARSDPGRRIPRFARRVATKMFNFLTKKSMFSLQNMGIKDEFHQKALLACIDELKGKQQHPADLEAPRNADDTENEHTNLTQLSFSTLERCGKCQKYLRGFLRQGYFCQGNLFNLKYKGICKFCI